ncbi:WXG100 family type VII secretion target [Nocardia sp. alder85J]|uniref:WXG100 family type VII secretion target n=1 Tax=Nocardia sp. alder85J TaxID=2862949 RepID=UPI001CD1E59C|nr:type VII secretion target [Nocardia sp. alder85J]MCX4096254.1 type VII secretion target [Nocardia sp. alder85J]
MNDSIRVDPAALTDAADGINAITGELSGLGTKETGASGRGFALISLTGLQAGKSAVHQAFSAFTDRWSWGVRTMVQSADALARTLGLAAGRYHEEEQTASNMFKEMYTNIAGNPHLSHQDADNRTWSQTLADNSYNDIRHPDYSASSFSAAWDHMVRNGKIIATVAPDALANAGPTPTRWNTGDAARAAQIMNGK